MAIISANLQFNRGGHGLLDYSSLQTNYSAAMTWAKDANSNAAVGQFIYLAEAETIEGVEYAKGPYVVDAIGEGAVLTPLSKSVAGEQDLSGAITDLKGSVGTLTSNLATTDAAVKELESTINDIPNTYATKAELEEAIGNVDFSELATKEEVTNGLAEKANASDVYTKEEVDAELAKKLEASDVADFATKGELSEGLAEKANASDIYTKDEVDGIKSTIEGALAEVKETADAAATNEAFVEYTNANDVAVGANATAISEVSTNLNAHTTNTDVHINEGERERWTNAAAAIEAFKDAENIGDDVIDTLKEIQDYITADASAADAMTKNIAAAQKGVEDAKASIEELTEVVNNNHTDALNAAASAETNANSYTDGLVAGVNTEVEKKLDKTSFEEYKTANDAIVSAKVDNTTYEAKMKEIDDAFVSLNSSVSDVYTKEEVDGLISPLATKSEVEDGLATKANASDVYTKEEVNAELAKKLEASDVADFAIKSEVEESLNGKVDVVEGKGLSTNDFTDDLKNKLESVNVDAEVNVVKSVDTNSELTLSDSGVLSVNLEAYAKSGDVENSLATKLDATAKVNGVSFVDGEATISGDDIALGTAITRSGKDDTIENVYDATTSLQSVLASLSQRIDVLDPNVSGELGITSITAGNGINASVSGGQATISVKSSNVEGNVAEVKTDGVYVADMRSYWEEI